MIDESKRAQLGAHYTSEDDIMLIVEPVLMAPLRQKWDAVRRQSQVTVTSEVTVTYELLADFANEIASVRVLDPACGSGNFLYVALRQLLGLQKEVIAYAARKGLPEIELSVSPEQLYGIEINPYAHELAQVTAWIGYLQWRNENGFGEMADPILRPLHNIQRMDAILASDETGNPIEPEWPAADIIIGNPPFLGSKKMRTELGDTVTKMLSRLYGDQVHGESDLVCYWFEKARKLLTNGNVERVGLLATNSVRGGFNRQTLERIKEAGDIFYAWSDRAWILDGAAVRVSIVGFDNGQEKLRTLNGETVSTINSDLTSSVDITKAKKLIENANLSFQGTAKVGPFDLDESEAKHMLAMDNPDGRLNHEVVKPWINAIDITRRPRNKWIIDFGVNLPNSEAAKYIHPFEHVKTYVKPQRDKVKRKRRREKWVAFWRNLPWFKKRGFLFA